MAASGVRVTDESLTVVGLLTFSVVISAVFAAVVGIIVSSAGITGAWPGGIGVGDTSGMVATSVASVGSTVLAAVLGLGVGMIARHNTVAVSGLLVWGLVIENLLTVFHDRTDPSHTASST